MMKIFFSFFLIIGSLVANAQIISTFVGTGSATVSGDGGLATAAGIDYPYGCTVDNYGNFYFGGGGGMYGGLVRKITPCGIITTIAGTGVEGYNGDGIAATAAKLNGPAGIVVDSIGNLYIADVLNNRVRKVDIATGIISTIAGNGTLGSSGDGGAATASVLYNPANLCFDKQGNLYIVDNGNSKIRKINTTGVISTFAGTGTGGYTGDTGPATAAEIEDMYGICADTIGNIYFEQQGLDARVRKIDMSGIVTTIAGNGFAGPAGDGGPATSAALNPFGLSCDKSGNLYIAGFHDNDVRKIDPTGVIYTVAGKGTAGYSGDGGLADSAELNVPYGIATDAFGNLYIADEVNRRVRKVTFNTVITPLVTIIANPGDTICGGTSTSFTATVIGASTLFTYQWYVNGAFITGATASTYSYVPINGDSVSCVLSVSGICNTPFSNTIIMMVAAISTPTITVTAPAAAAVGSTVTVNATVAGAGSGYSINWYNNSALFSTTAALITTYTKAAGTDHITATVVPGETGCYDSTMSAITTVTASTTGAPSRPSPEGKEVLRSYPNPLKDLLYVDDVSAEAAYKIRSVVGSAVLQGTLQQGSNTINVKDLPAGVYMLEVVYADGGRVTSKIIKQ